MMHVSVAPRGLTPLSQYGLVLIIPAIATMLKLLLLHNLVVKNFCAHLIIDEHNILDSSCVPYWYSRGSFHK